MNNYRILVINPGSTSTKLAVFENEKAIWKKTVRHSSEELARFAKVVDQYEYRRELLLKELAGEGIDLSNLSAVVGRGGLLKPLDGGTYLVDDAILEDLKYAQEHASNLGALLAKGIADQHGIPAFIVDPVCVDEMEEVARITGFPEISRKSIFHALNVKAVARLAAQQSGKKLQDCNFIVVHLGGGITINALQGGRAVDVCHGLEEGPMTPERSGSLPMLQFLELCFSGKYTKEQLKQRLVGKGGLVAHLGTNDADLVERRALAGEPLPKLLYEAMAYQIAKFIGSQATVLKGRVDAIIMTGGLANSVPLVDWVRERVEFIAPVLRIPGEMEMEALAQGALRVISGEEQAKRYGEKVLSNTGH